MTGFRGFRVQELIDFRLWGVEGLGFRGLVGFRLLGNFCGFFQG